MFKRVAFFFVVAFGAAVQAQPAWPAHLSILHNRPQ
jgi:hypothetical protein